MRLRVCGLAVVGVVVAVCVAVVVRACGYCSVGGALCLQDYILYRPSTSNIVAHRIPCVGWLSWWLRLMFWL